MAIGRGAYRAGLFAVCLSLLVQPITAAEPTPSITAAYPLKIAPQPLGNALQELARQSGIQIVFFSRVTKELTAERLDGTYTVIEAMEHLLADSGLTFRALSDHAVEVRPMSRAERQATTAARSQTAPRSAEAMEELLVRGTVEQLAVTRVATPIHELPQTVSVVTLEDMRELNATDLHEVLDHVPGVTVVQVTSLNQQFISRGFEISTFHVDGGAAVNPRIDSAYPIQAMLPAPDLSEYERVEILRGSDALFGGFGNPGGTVSLVRKRPREEFAFDAAVIGGSWDNTRVELDLTGPLARDGAFRGRAVAMYSNQHYFYEVAQREHAKIFGVLEYDLTPDATLTAGGSFETDDATPALNGLPLFLDGTDTRFARDRSLAFDWNFSRTDVTQGYVQYRQNFADSWALRFNAAGWKARVEQGLGQYIFPVDPETNSLFEVGTAEFSLRPSTHDQISFDATLTGTFSLFGLRTEVAVGGDIMRLRLRNLGESYSGVGPQVMDIYAFDRHQYPDPREALTPWSWADTTVQLDQHGVYSSMRVHFGEAWTATVGARATTARITRDIYSEDDIFGVFEYFAREEESDVVTPLVGLMYAFNDGLSWYASYARTYLHEDDRVFPINETGFGTIKGTNIETGLKGRWRDGALTGSLVAYSVRQPGWGVLDFDVLAYVRRMRQSHGVDLELQGESDSGWRFGGGYTWNVNEDETGEPMSRATPRNLLKLWADRNLAGALERWMVGGSLHAQSALTDSNAIICPVGFRDFCDLVTAKQPSYAILDLRGSYDLDAHWKLALGVNNVFDKVYYQTFNPPGTWFRGWYGEPRNFTVRVDARF